MTAGDEEQPETWVIRFTEKAFASLKAAQQHITRTAGEEIGYAWREGMEAEIMRLSRMPESLPAASENHRFVATVRSLLCRRTPRGPASRVLFILRRPPEESSTVTIINIRHGAQKPITKKETREIEEAE